MSGPGQASDRRLKKLPGLACFMFCWRSDARAVDRIITCFNLQSNHLVNQGIFSQFNIKSFLKGYTKYYHERSGQWSKHMKYIQPHDISAKMHYFVSTALLNLRDFERVSGERSIWGAGYCLNIQYKVRSWWSSERPIHTKRGSHSPLPRRWDDHKY